VTVDENRRQKVPRCRRSTVKLITELFVADLLNKLFDTNIYAITVYQMLLIDNN